MSGHQIVGMPPSRQRLHPLAPGSDRRMILADVEAEFLDGIVEIAGKRHVGDGRLLAKQEFAALEPLVDDAEIAVDASLEKGEHRRIARWLGEILQEAIGAEKPVDLLIVEDDPA